VLQPKKKQVQQVKRQADQTRSLGKQRIIGECMNLNLEKLIMLARISTDQKFIDNLDSVPRHTWESAFREKFAELIVTEITDILVTYRTRVIFEDGIEYNCEHPIVAIRKHFGVNK
jgi:hypothetical protein